MNDMTFNGSGNGTPARMTSREIADLLDVRHDSVRRTIERLADKAVIQLPPLVEVKNHLGQTIGEYVFSGEQGKRDSYVVVAQLSPEFTARLVDRWQELEQRQPVAINVRNLPQLQTIALQLIEVNKEQSEQIAAMTPKVEAMALLEASEGSVGPRLASKMLDVPERKFTAWLQANHWAFRQNGVGPLQAYVDKRNAGYLEHRPHTYRDHGSGEDKTIAQLMITPKGLAKIAQKLSEGRA